MSGAVPTVLPSPATPGRWRSLTLISVALLLGMSGWFAATAVSPELQTRWGLDTVRAGWLTTSVQLGFVAGTAVAALLNLADLVPARTYFGVSAVLAAAANVSLLVAPGFAPGVLGRFLTGFFLAGVYPPAMKMVATWFVSARGLAIGTVVGALTVGKAGPWLLKAGGGASMTPVVVGTSLAGVAAGLLVLLAWRDGPHRFERRPFSWGLVGRLLRHRPTLLATGGYLGHMWELYAMWAAIGAFLLEAFSAGAPGSGAVAAAVATFAVIAAGGVGAVVAGTWADRWGRERVASGAMLVSGACALVLGWLVHAPVAVVVAIGLVWGTTIVADSAQFSALVTEVAPSHAVGTALTVQTSLGFALTGVSIWTTSWISERFGWGPAFALLALGPAAGILCMARLRRLRATVGGAG